MIFETCVDFLFVTDIIINFFSAYEDQKVGLEVRLRKIAMNYLCSWFALDICSCIPLQLMELETSGSNDSSQNHSSKLKLIRLSRLPRLYRLMRILRLFKLLRLFKSNQTFKKIFDLINVNVGIVKMITVLVSVFFLVHLVGCFWFMQAKLDDFNPDTWVVRLDYVNEESGVQYLASLYWALQTLTTVGFGDINAFTYIEKIMAIIWMLFGIGFYSFTIGNLSQIIASMDIRSELLGQKLNTLQEFTKRTTMPQSLYIKIRKHLESNSKFTSTVDHQEKLLHELPSSLRSEVIKHTHGEIIQKINFFRDKDPDLLWAVLPILRPLKLLPQDVLYTQGEHSDEIYFIKQGKIKLYVEVNIPDPNYIEPEKFPFIAYVEGSYFGDSDIFF